jgi:hypothetical protein
VRAKTVFELIGAAGAINMSAPPERRQLGVERRRFASEKRNVYSPRRKTNYSLRGSDMLESRIHYYCNGFINLRLNEQKAWHLMANTF